MSAIQNMLKAEQSQKRFPAPQQVPVMQEEGMGSNAAVYELAGQTPNGATQNMGFFGNKAIGHGLIMAGIAVVIIIIGAWVMEHSGKARNAENRVRDAA